MAIHISCEGLIKTSEDQQAFIEQVKKACEEFHLVCDIQNNEGKIYICPNGMIEWNIENYYVVCKTNTALVGPGYHAFVCEFFEYLQQCGELYLSIDDECEYSEDHDFERIQEMYFDPYLMMLCDRLGSTDENEEATYAWDNKSFLPVAKEGCVITPMGYIRYADCRHLSLEDARSMFYIWNQKEKDAIFYRNSALVSLWSDCTFEAADGNESAMRINESICVALEKAHELDPTLPMPVDEYQQLCRCLNRKIAIFDVDQYPQGLIGYRKEAVFFVYGNWFIYFQGNSSQRFDGHSMILEIKEAEESRCSMTITGYKNNEPMDFAYRYLNSVDALDTIDFQNETMHCKGVLHELHDDNHTLYLQAQLICDKEMLMINCECADMESYHQAIDTLNNIQFFKNERSEVNVRI